MSRVKPTRACMRCKETKPAEDYPRPTARRCNECSAEVERGGVCKCCGERTELRVSGAFRLYCDRKACQAEKMTASTREYHEEQRQIMADRTHSTCPGCALSLPLTLEFWAPLVRVDGDVARFDRCCRSCRAAIQRDYYRTSATIRTSALRRAEEQRGRENERRAADPAFNAECLARKRAWERARRIRNRQKKTPMLRDRVDAGEFPPLPARPLAEAIVARVDDDGDLQAACLGFGTNVRNVTAWLSGERSTVMFDVADRVLGAMGLNWHEVWDDSVADVWEGEMVA